MAWRGVPSSRASSRPHRVELLHVDPIHPDPASIARAAGVLRNGGLVAFPTETVYGLGANALDADAVARIYAAKGRPAWNPVISHVASVADARALVAVWPDSAERLATAFWPGPLTLVLPRGAGVPAISSAGLDAVAVRMPAHPVALALIAAAGVPVAAPSANRFTRVSPTTAQHVVESLGDRVDLVLDGGSCAVGIESTVCDLSGALPTLLRPGMISRAAIESVLGGSVQLASLERLSADDGSAPSQHSPGMADRHYAPHADVWLVESAQVAPVAASIVARVGSAPHATGAATAQRAADSITVLLLGERTSLNGAWVADGDRIVRLPDDPVAYATRLYAALHDADAHRSSVVIIERPPETDAWMAILDRLTRAAR